MFGAGGRNEILNKSLLVKTFKMPLKASFFIKSPMVDRMGHDVHRKYEYAWNGPLEEVDLPNLQVKEDAQSPKQVIIKLQMM